MVPPPIWSALRKSKHVTLRTFRRCCEAAGFVIARRSDYYSPLPSEFELRKTAERWNRPSALTGVRYDLAAMKQRLSSLADKCLAEFAALPPYAELAGGAFGPGYPHVDAFVL